MAQLIIDVPDELALRLEAVKERLVEILESGYQEVTSDSVEFHNKMGESSPRDFTRDKGTKASSRLPKQLQSALAREKQTYLHMHAMLVEQYLGQYVAIYQGRLIDHDSDKLALYARIEKGYPNEFVLMRQVESVPERELVFRSPRFVENG